MGRFIGLEVRVRRILVSDLPGRAHLARKRGSGAIVRPRNTTGTLDPKPSAASRAPIRLGAASTTRVR